MPTNPNAQPLAPLVAKLPKEWGAPVQAAARAQDSFNAAIQAALAAILGAVVWTPLTPTNSWTYFGAPLNAPAWYQDWTGRVWLRGLVQGGTLGAAIFTQPVPKPSAVQNFSSCDVGGVGQVQVALDGTIQLVATSTASFATLDGLSYLP